MEEWNRDSVPWQSMDKEARIREILARYEVCMTTGRLLSIVLRFVRDATLQLVLPRIIQLVWCTPVLWCTGGTIVARTSVVRCWRGIAVFHSPVSDTILRAKASSFRPVTGDVCRLSYPRAVGIRASDSGWQKRDIGCYARTYVCIILVDDKSFDVVSVCCHLTRVTDKCERLCSRISG